MDRMMNWRMVVITCVAGALIWAAVIDGVAHAAPTRAQVKHAIDPAFRRTPHVALGVLALALVADVLTTQQAIHRGCHEANPIYGPHPATGTLVLTHAALLGFAWGARLPAWADYTGAALFAGVSLHNATIRCAP